jgi:Cu(I)/Ag(I) efflux system membrane fusion protein
MKASSLILFSLFTLLALPAYAAERQQDAQARAKADPKPYPLPTCVVSGEKFGGAMGEPVVFVHQGREIKLCCKSCRKDFEVAPARFLEKVDAAAKKVKPYPLKTCLVSDEKLGSMGKPLVFVHDFHEIKLCCKSCKKDFTRHAKQYLGKLKETPARTPHVEPHAHHQHEPHQH